MNTLEKIVISITKLSDQHRNDTNKLIDVIEMINHRIDQLELENDLINKVWMYEDTKLNRGGVVIADSIDTAKQKVNNESLYTIDNEYLIVYPLRSLDLTNDVHELWKTGENENENCGKCEKIDE